MRAGSVWGERGAYLAIGIIYNLVLAADGILLPQGGLIPLIIQWPVELAPAAGS